MFIQKIRKKFFELLSLKYTFKFIQIYQINHSILLQLNLFIFIFKSFTMTCDFELIESWTAHLFKSTVSKWVSLISFNASTKSQNVIISWNINMNQQLRQWAINQSNEIIKMLIELKDQQNMILKLNECYKCIKTEQGWSFNQFAMHVSEYFV